MFKHLLTASFGAVMIVLPLATSAAVAKESPAAPPPALIQPGDAQLPCPALAAQINELAIAEVTPKKKKKGFSLGSLGKVLMVANPMTALAAPMLGGNGMGGMLVGQAASMAQNGATAAEARDQADAAMSAAAPSIESQRKARLMTLFEAKRC